MPELQVHSYLNYSRVLHPSTIGQIMGPDRQEDFWQVIGLEERTDGKPGTLAVLKLLRMGD